ncbi:MAG: hypothetical protein ACREIA_20685 [Opitutaceae bacterium]
MADVLFPFPTLPPELVDRLNRENTIVVRNKIDLVNGRATGACAHDLGAPTVDVSALNGDGLGELNAEIVRLLDRLVGAGVDGTGLVNLRHLAALDACFARLSNARRLLLEEEGLELAAAELRNAVANLGEIVGRIDNEAMLDRLFAGFCIGK